MSASWLLTSNATDTAAINALIVQVQDVTTNANGALPLAGGTMQGPINMNGNYIVNLAPPATPDAAARKQEIDYLQLSADVALAGTATLQATKQDSNASLSAISQSVPPPNATYVRGNGTVFELNTIQPADLPPHIDATNIADGSVDNTEYGYLHNTTDNIQSQLTSLQNDKQDVNAQLSTISNSTPTSGFYLRGNGTEFVSAPIAAGDMPSGISASKFANNTVTNAQFECLDGVSGPIQTQINGKISTSLLAVPNGVATLDAQSQLQMTQIPTSLIGALSYQGTWNALTNTPSLQPSPSASTTGYYYVVSVGGVRFAQTWSVGDWIISNGVVWQKIDNQTVVSSVYGRTGAVVAENNDYSADMISNTPNVGVGSITATNVQDALTQLDQSKVALAGAAMQGVINMNVSNSITNLPGPVNPSDAVRKAYVDTKQEGDSKLTSIANSTPTAATYLRGNGTAFVPTAIAAADLPSGINATNIGASGLVNNSEFDCLDGVLSPIQAQIDAVSPRTNLLSSSATTTTVNGNVNFQSMTLNSNGVATAGSVLDLGAATSSILVPKGTTAQQPALGVPGMIRYNTSLAAFEGYTSSWGPFGGSTFDPTITSPAAGDVLTYDSASSTWTNSVVPVASAPTLTISLNIATITAPVFVVANVTANSYRIQVANDSAFSSLVVDSGYQASSTFNINPYVTANNTYYVRGLVRTSWSNKVTQWSATITYVAPESGTGAYVWSTRMGGVGDDNLSYITSVARDAADNMLYIGNYNSPSVTVYNADGTAFSRTVPGNANTSSGIVVKYNSSGAVQWVTYCAGSGNTSNGVNVSGIQTDVNNNVFVSGTYYDIAGKDFVFYNADGTPFGTRLTPNPADGKIAFLCKLDASGFVQWLARIQGPSGTSGLAYTTFNLNIDKTGNPYIYIDFNSTIGIYNASGALVASYTTDNNIDCCLVRYLSNGTVSWSVQLGSAGAHDYNGAVDPAIAIDSANNVAISIFYIVNFVVRNADGTTFTTLPNTPGGNPNAAIIKYTSTGSVVWAQCINNGAIVCRSLTFNSNNDLVTAAIFQGPDVKINYNGSVSRTLPPSEGGQYSGLLVTFEGTTGAVLWLTVQLGMCQPTRVIVDNDDNCIFTAQLFNNITLYNADGSIGVQLGRNSGSYTSNSGIIFTAKYNPVGMLQWAAKLDGIPSASLFFSTIPSIVVDTNGNVFVAAQYTYGNMLVYNGDGTLFGTYTLESLNSSGYSSAVIMYSSSGAVQWVNKMANTYQVLVRRLKLYGNNNVMAVMDYQLDVSATLYNSDGSVYTVLPYIGRTDIGMAKIM